MRRDADKVGIFVLQGITMEVCMDEAEREKSHSIKARTNRDILFTSLRTPHASFSSEEHKMKYWSSM